MSEKKFWKLTPHLPVPDVRVAVEWYKQNLGFGEEWFYGDPPTDGGCRRDEMRVIFGIANPFEAPKDFSLILFVSGIGDILEEMSKKELPLISPLQTYDYGIKEFAIRDCNGYLLRFAENI